MLESNILIAEFMGYILIDEDWGLYETPECMYDIRDMAGDMNTQPSLQEMCFGESWNWLMPVVERIESLGYSVAIVAHICRIQLDGDGVIVISENQPKIEGVYKAVTQFIEWYNETESSAIYPNQHEND